MDHGAVGTGDADSARHPLLRERIEADDFRGRDPAQGSVDVFLRGQLLRADIDDAQRRPYRRPRPRERPRRREERNDELERPRAVDGLRKIDKRFETLVDRAVPGDECGRQAALIRRSVRFEENPLPEIDECLSPSPGRVELGGAKVAGVLCGLQFAADVAKGVLGVSSAACQGVLAPVSSRGLANGVLARPSVRR